LFAYTTPTVFLWAGKRSASIYIYIYIIYIHIVYIVYILIALIPSPLGPSPLLRSGLPGVPFPGLTGCAAAGAGDADGCHGFGEGDPIAAANGHSSYPN